MNLKHAELTPNPWSRPQRPLQKVKGLVLHWVGNPGTSAMFNRNYFERRKRGKTGYGSAHFIIDLSGEILLCIPTTEMAYHVGADQYTGFGLLHYGPYPNDCTIGIEFCHPDWEGRYTPQTVEAAAELCVLLCEQFELEPLEDGITTHHAITGKLCPKWYVQHPQELVNFRQVVETALVRRMEEGSDWSDCGAKNERDQSGR